MGGSGQVRPDQDVSRACTRDRPQLGKAGPIGADGDGKDRASRRKLRRPASTWAPACSNTAAPNLRCLRWERSNLCRPIEAGPRSRRASQRRQTREIGPTWTRHGRLMRCFERPCAARHRSAAMPAKRCATLRMSLASCASQRMPCMRASPEADQMARFAPSRSKLARRACRTHTVASEGTIARSKRLSDASLLCVMTIVVMWPVTKRRAPALNAPGSLQKSRQQCLRRCLGAIACRRSADGFKKPRATSLRYAYMMGAAAGGATNSVWRKSPRGGNKAAPSRWTD